MAKRYTMKIGNNLSKHECLYAHVVFILKDSWKEIKEWSQSGWGVISRIYLVTCQYPKKWTPRHGGIVK